MINPTDFADFKNGENYSERNVLAFVSEHGIALGIVVGRMQREGLIKYSMLNDLKVQYTFTV